MKGKITGKGKKRKYFIDGRQVTARVFHRAFPPQTGEGELKISTSWRKPIHSQALSVHRKLIGQAMARAAKKGVPTEFDKEGCPVFTSRKHRIDYMASLDNADRHYHDNETYSGRG